MKEPSSDSQDLYTDLNEESINEEDMAARLLIYVDNNGEIMYNCDWEPTEEGLIGMASIFYKLLVDDLSSQIFTEVKSQCVSSNSEEDFITISSLIAGYHGAVENYTTGDDVVIPPDRIMNI